MWELTTVWYVHLPTHLPKTNMFMLNTSILYESIQGYMYKKLPVRHCTMILMEVLYPTALDTHTPKVWFGP
jgi:hypothetical protein